jgi:hypothetical protein
LKYLPVHEEVLHQKLVKSFIYDPRRLDLAAVCRHLPLCGGPTALATEQLLGGAREV